MEPFEITTNIYTTLCSKYINKLPLPFSGKVWTFGHQQAIAVYAACARHVNNPLPLFLHSMAFSYWECGKYCKSLYNKHAHVYIHLYTGVVLLVAGCCNNHSLHLCFMCTSNIHMLAKGLCF